MKKVYYEVGPEVIEVGPKNKAVKMFVGEPREFEDETADLLLAKPMFKEFKEPGSGADPGAAGAKADKAKPASPAERVVGKEG